MTMSKEAEMAADTLMAICGRVSSSIKAAVSRHEISKLNIIYQYIEASISLLLNNEIMKYEIDIK